MRSVCLVLCLALSACTAAQQPKPASALADVQTIAIEAHFLGRPYDPKELYVCSGISGRDFACIPFAEFMEHLQKP